MKTRKRITGIIAALLFSLSGTMYAQTPVSFLLQSSRNTGEHMKFKEFTFNCKGNSKTKGFIGIGTDNPLQELHIKGGNILLSSGDCNLAGTNGSIFFGKDVDINKPFGEWGIEYFEDAVDKGLNFWRPASSTSQTLNFALFLSNTGNVAIGTSKPAAKFHVEGDAFISQHLRIGDGTKDARLDVAGYIASSSLRSGGGKKMVVSDEDGLLYIENLPVGDNLGDHIATKNLTLGSYSISNSGTRNSISIDTDENVNFSNSIFVSGKVYGTITEATDAFGKLELFGSTKPDAARIEIWQGGSANNRSIKFAVYDSTADFQFFHSNQGALIHKLLINRDKVIVGTEENKMGLLVNGVISAQKFESTDNFTFKLIDGGELVDKFKIGVNQIIIGAPNKNIALNVNGIINSREVKVALEDYWPDYVFTPGYQLPALQQVENFIKTNGHLPGIPNAQTVEKDGINLGEMNALLLKKIEELTLYVIDLQKNNEQMSREIEKLKDTVEATKE